MPSSGTGGKYYSCDQAMISGDGLITQLGNGNHGLAHATFDTTMRHRFGLGRVWDKGKPIVAFCMLNPSTADAFKLDPTINRCFRFCSAWGYGGLIVVNLFSIRATNPKEIYASSEPSLPINDIFIDKAGEVADMFMVAWGNHGIYQDRGRGVLDRLRREGKDVFRLGSLTSKCMPRHPLYLSRDEKPILM